MNTKIKCLAGFILGAICSSSYSTTFYVSTSSNASDNNGGSQSSPWATPNHAATNAKAGDTVLFEDGTYSVTEQVKFRNKGTINAPITFKAINKHAAKITQPINSAGDAFFSIGIYSSGWVEHQEMYLIFDSLDISGGKRHTIQSAGGGQLVIKNSLIHGSGNDPIKINSGSDYILIENNEIYDSGLTDTTCISTHTCNSDGIDITSSDFVTVRNNHIHDITSWGLYTKKGSANTIVENNLIHDVLEGGIGLGESTVTYNAIARNNILYNIEQTCLQFSGAKDSKFYNNTCYNVSTFGGANWTPMRIAPAQHTAGARDGDDKYSRNVESYNNIFVMNNIYGVCLKVSDPSFIAASSKSENIKHLKMDNNVCYNLTNGIEYSWTFEGKTIIGADNWKAYTADLGTPLSVNSHIGENPQFLDITQVNSSNYFMTDAGSITKDAGFDVSDDVVYDYFGHERDFASIDIGAVENTLNRLVKPVITTIVRN